MISESLHYIVWEKDILNSDDIFRSPQLKIIANAIDTAPITITQDKYYEGIDGDFTLSVDSDKDLQQYYIEIIPLNSKAKSISFGIDDESKRSKMDNVKSAAQVHNTQIRKTDSSCICKEQYADLIWGGKVSCELLKSHLPKQRSGEIVFLSR